MSLDAHAIFRRHFEEQFAPLPIVTNSEKVTEQLTEKSDEESSWDGISDEDQGAVPVVDHTHTGARGAAMSKRELRSFLTSKVPQSGSPMTQTKDMTSDEVEDDMSERANLKNDLALQRLLAESHLLESSSNPTLHGRNRLKATDLRLQALGAKKSILLQDKMPMSHRRGIVAKQKQREEKRRREAKENGIILEKVNMAKNEQRNAKRERGVGDPGVGKFRAGTLRLSKKDIHHIEGPRTPSSFGKRSKRAPQGKR